ncbi:MULTISPECIES: NAD-dependent succinate-semialdehyde dehydrogenase [unclassified Mesorhizobium]|uniref:NAD-dependent succinate-semialdehyde dehydrogenase n=1 Tax=unclassified Mesorhizobium TaxID=325217 RepID=UPI000FC9BAC7|nr:MULTISPECIES: NAD-dependent succinate-semialdehyde dehydrogenase [unclassified Mesorhizobium]TGP21524.1 NAD-dependent succinate-semialdehyde dehydrogenase [Mesorhizobium sp. M1D.F.Ca.ET.231.01.1.1]TGP28970.1 NAD-dependent succinate-semialdehyde dehydrogenase [Mesorhizobium sp. M1D.F.Ca.ET.234.01.1.1]TGS43439.1 NAD-dependent succinate-semialdehyde dehydrogenase [Mesorhizobium sp. M1D.F.Ca.ET.184.01.1.1]TGS59986.1 NAD-dependent succinate-semialdehyde dehydrogenase [Mesorhizobium sp. M1D.F.Ca.E
MLDRLNKDLLKSQAFLNGQFVGTGELPVFNPATGEMIGLVPNFGAEEAAAAVEAAAAAFRPWAGLTGKERGKILNRWYDLIIANRADLAAILTGEQGKPLDEALGEIDYAASYVEFYAEEAKRVAGEILSSHRVDARLFVLRQPIGVVAAITPWNFPAAMITRKVAPALAAGCPVVVKPAPETPLTALALAELASRAGFPAGVFNVITGDAVAIGGVLTSHPKVRVVGFTGSTEIGKLLARQSTGTLKKVALELGGNAPFIVFDDADLDAAVTGAIQSKFRNMGQTCVCTNRIYVQSGIHDAFVERLVDGVKELIVGDGFDKGVTQGPLITEEAVLKVECHIADAVAQGAVVKLGGKRHARGRTFFEPTVLTGMTDVMAVAREETFGPVAAVFSFEHEDEVIEAANAAETGLAAYFYSRDASRIFRVMERLEYGMVGVNTGLISTELAPFGGIKESGNSREGSHHGMAEFLELKYACLAVSL